jgi:hypothetical protein
MEQKKRYSKVTSSRGGARVGAGRPKGSTNKITMESLIASLDGRLGKSYADQVADNYVTALGREDWNGVRDYDRFLLGKVVADKIEVETTEAEDAITAKTEAFTEALKALATLGRTNK